MKSTCFGDDSFCSRDYNGTMAHNLIHKHTGKFSSQAIALKTMLPSALFFSLSWASLEDSFSMSASRAHKMVSEFSSDSEDCKWSSHETCTTPTHRHTNTHMHTHTQLSYQAFGPFEVSAVGDLTVIITAGPLAWGRASGGHEALPDSPHPCPARVHVCILGGGNVAMIYR